jgi:hypothetical protein
MEYFVYFMLFLVGILGGVINAVAGGASFFTFPAFLATGIPPIVANASNLIAVWPGNTIAVYGYREHLHKYSGDVKLSIIIALTGGGFGALILTFTGNLTFVRLIPFLILFATVIFAFGNKISKLISSNSGDDHEIRHNIKTRVMEFLFALYGGFFGAGLGIMLMAGLQILGINDIQLNNALKNLLGALISLVAVVIFSISGIVAWDYTIPAFVGAIIGGFIGARFAQWLSAKWLRRVVISFGSFLSIYYFLKYYTTLIA